MNAGRQYTTGSEADTLALANADPEARREGITPSVEWLARSPATFWVIQIGVNLAIELKIQDC